VTLIVSDNSPLNLLIRIGLAEILPKLFTLVVIPPEVAQEMRHHKAPQPVRDFISSPPSWLKIMVPKTLIQFPKLDPGESAAISLAVELRAILLIDEHDGREAAATQGVPVVGAIGVLEQAANCDLVTDLAKAHAQIKSLRFHVSDRILSDSLARHLAKRKNRRSN
jgi:predicted nucleic acid-binding protein